MQIEEYLKPICQIIIEEYNIIFKGYSVKEIREIANEKISESEIAFRIGKAFQTMVHYTIKLKDNRNQYKVNNDIVVDFLDRQLVIEVKTPKGYLSDRKNDSNGYPWDPFGNDFKWLKEEICLGNRGNRAFVLGWLNCVDYIGQILQIGKGPHSGCKPKIHEDKEKLLPFLKDSKGEQYAKDYAYDYSIADKVIKTAGDNGLSLNCIFIGRETDALHFAIYF